MLAQFISIFIFSLSSLLFFKRSTVAQKCHLTKSLKPEHLHVSQCRETNNQASLRTCADSPEPSLLTYIKYECRLRLRQNFRPLPTLELVFKGGFCIFAISTCTIILCTGSLVKYLYSSKTCGVLNRLDPPWPNWWFP